MQSAFIMLAKVLLKVLFMLQNAFSVVIIRMKQGIRGTDLYAYRL